MTAHSQGLDVLNDSQRKANLRLALILASVALAFGVGFIVRIWWLG